MNNSKQYAKLLATGTHVEERSWVAVDAPFVLPPGEYVITLYKVDSHLGLEVGQPSIESFIIAQLTPALVRLPLLICFR